ncbi:predicted protein, partial [Nematostella vectensis]
QLFINNEFVDCTSGKVFPTINPTTGEKICDISEGDKEDVDKAVKAAKEAFKLGSAWRTMDASMRGKLLYKLAQLIDRDIAYLASLETIDSGKLFSDSVGDMQSSANCFRYYAGWADKVTGKTIPAAGFMILDLTDKYTTETYTNGRSVFCFGNKILQGSKIRSLQYSIFLVFACSKGCRDLRFLQKTPNIKNVGRLIQEASAKSNLKRLTLELGGKSPNIVFADSDMDYAVEIAHEALFFNQGQCCSAGSRTFVQDTIYDEFVKKSVERAKARTVGDPFDSVDQGPQIDQEQFDKIMDLIESGKKEGAKMQCGGARHGNKGFFIQPTVFSDVTDDMRIAKEEIFGPVQQLIKFKSVDEVIERANNTTYGLAAGVFTKNIDTAMAVSSGLRAGTVWINCYECGAPQAPFGGYKMSGYGREWGEYGVLPYCEVKTVCMYNARNFNQSTFSI